MTYFNFNDTIYMVVNLPPYFPHWFLWTATT
nr:MAG TPA: hypothetical protein [Bacteriophage sp.]